MNKLVIPAILATAMAAAIVIVPVSLAQRMQMSGGPPNIAAENWIAIGDTAGFVVTSGDFQGSDRTTGTLQGYFMVRRAGVWFRAGTATP